MTDATFNFDISFEVVDDNLAKAFVNDEYVGRVKNTSSKIIFRCSRNPFRNYVPNFENFDNLPMSDLIKDRRFLQNAMPIILRNYLRNYSYLGAVLPEPTAPTRKRSLSIAPRPSP